MDFHATSAKKWSFGVQVHKLLHTVNDPLGCMTETYFMQHVFPSLPYFIMSQGNDRVSQK